MADAPSALQAEEASKLAAQQEAKAARRRADELEVGTGAGRQLWVCSPLAL